MLRMATARRGSVARLVALFALFGLGALAVLTYSTLTISNRTVRDQAEQRVSAVGQVSRALVREDVRGLEGVVEAYAARQRLQEAVTRGNVAEIRRHLDQLRESRPELSAAWVARPDGVIVDIVPETPGVVGQSFAHRDWYRGVVDANATYVAEAVEGAATGNPLVAPIVTPIEVEGTVVGILGSGYGLRDIDAFLEEFNRDQGFELTLTDQRGRVLATSTGGTALFDDLSDDPGIRAALGGLDVIIETNDDVVAAYAPIDDIGWTISASIPRAEVFAPLVSLRRTVLSIAGVLALVVLGGLALLTLLLRRQRGAEERGREAEERQRLLLDSTGDGIIGVDLDGTCVFANPAGARMFGYDVGELLSHDMHALLHDASDESGHSAADCPLQRSLNEGAQVQVDDETWRHRDRSPVPVEYSAFPLRSDGAITGAVVTVRDISERLLSQRELAAARDTALEANRLKSAFLANMSHEIRTPMNGVMGMTSLLLDTPLDPVQREYVETIRTSSDALLTVINDILDFSKIEAGRLDIEAIDYDIRTVVEQVAELLAGPAHDKGLELLLDIAPEVPEFVHGDPSRVRQILTNLVSNAVKFTNEGEVIIRLRVEGTAVPRLRFEVVDTGIGISPEIRDRLFAPFTQADVSTTRRFGGTGLGLTISRQLVELMDGTIGVESTPGRGSRFWFHLPLDVATTAPQPFTPRADLAGVHALIVDDNEINRRVLCDMIERWGMTGEAVTDGRKAIDLARERSREGRPFDIALLDFHMPEIDGIEVGRALSGDPETSATRLVMLTSAASRTEAAEAQSAGIVGYITKPIRRGALYTLLTGALGHEHASRDERPLVETGRSARLLVVEDNPVNQRITAYLLEKSGHRVDVAGNGIEALAMIRQGRYDAVLMDVQMPEMDGWEATEELRRRERHEGVETRLPVVGLTAAATGDDIERCFGAGMDDVVTKPVREEDLLSTVDRWTGARADFASPAAPDEPRPTTSGAGDGPPHKRAADLDDETLMSLVDLDPDGSQGVVDRLSASFVEEAAARVAELRDAAAESDADAMRRSAHRLKGSSLYFGARLVSHIARTLEDQGRDEHLEGASDLVEQLDAEVERLRTELPAALDRLRRSRQDHS